MPSDLNKEKRIELTGNKIRLSTLYPNELAFYRDLDPEIAHKLGAEFGLKTLPNDTRLGITERLIPRVEKAGENWLLHTIWLIIAIPEQIICGAIGFKGEPDENGAIEAGAAMYEGFMNRGYMTEATILLCDWALKQEKVKKIVACTNTDNFASQSVLLKSGFLNLKQDQETIWFEKTR